MNLFKKNKCYLGIDIGDTNIKIVELVKVGDEVKLSTYGYSEYTNFDNIAKRNLNNKPQEIAKIIKRICRKSGTTSHEAVASLPPYSVFSSVINLPEIGKNDIESAINFEAKKIIPLPLEEMILDWKEIGAVEKNGTRNYLLTGAPRNLVKKYIEIFKEAKINLLSLETETFSLIRSLIGEDKSSIMIVEIGAFTTDISIIDKSVPMLSRSLDIGGFTITRSISESLKVGLERAEQFKYDLGMSSFDSEDSVIPKTIAEAIAPIINEIKYYLNLFQTKNNKNVEKIVLSGGSSMLINLTNYLSKVLDMKVIISNPWSRISYPPDLKPVLDETGSKMSVAVGLAMRQID